MVVNRGLLFKGLGVCALCAGGTALIIKREDIGRLISSETEKKIIWGDLECKEPKEKEAGECSLKKEGKILVKKDTSSFEVSDLGKGKIKVYKVEKAEGDNAYSENFKFLIEDNDISGTASAGGATTNKLEEFESYEIKKGGKEDAELNGKHYLSRKTEAKKEIKDALGLPWELQDSSTEQTNINTEDLKKIKFSDGEASITGGTVTLTISKDSSKTDYPLGYKFSFKNTNTSGDATLKIGERTITLKNNSPVDFKIKKEGTSLSLEKAWTLEELTKKVGLVKDGENYWFVEKDGMNIKLNDSTKKTKLPKYENPEGRIKVYSEQAGYNEGLKFTVEKGDITLKEYTENSTVKHLLGQFQSFEIVKDSDGTWYFSRKDEGIEKLKNDLGLTCEFPTGTETSKECTLSEENIKKIKFDGLGSGTTASYTGTPKLTIYKESGRTYFPLGYKFVFSSESDATITIPSATPASITLKKDLIVDYKIKRSGENNQTITLEKAWTPESIMVKAAYFSKGNNNDEWVAGEDGVSIKQDSQKDTTAEPNTNSNSAKIKVYQEVPGYNQGYKFMVEGGDTSFSSNNNGISKLTKYETYEVVKDTTDNNYYFTRKKKSEESIRELLGIPDKCEMPTAVGTPKECDIDSSALNKIKFEGKGTTGTVTFTDNGSSIKLKISKEKDKNEFPPGYKFTFSSAEHGFTVPLTTPSSSITIKKNTNTEFKIKESGSTLTLEKAWTAESLGKKLKLTCTSSGSNKTCTFGEKINVWEGESNYVDDATVTESTGKSLTYELDQEGYNQGIKFTVTGEDIAISGTGGSATTKPTKICKNGDGGASYQIMEKTTGGSAKWYLVKK